MPKTLLLLDDEDAHRILTLRAIKATWPAFRVLEAATLATARELIAQQGRNISAFMIDFNLGNESGITLVKEIRSNAMLSSRPVLQLSTSELMKDIEAAYCAGASAFIFKGTDIAAFSANIVSALRFFLQ